MSSLDILDGDSINLSERTTGNGGGAMWDVVLSASVTENTFNIVQCTGIATLSLVLRIGNNANVKQFGAIGDGVTDNITVLQSVIDYAYLNGSIIDSGDYGDEFMFIGSINIPDRINFMGEGVFLGNVSGVRPTTLELRAEVGAANRLTSLQIYYSSYILLSSSSVFIGKSLFKDCLFVGSGAENIESRGLLELQNCACHTIGLKAYKSGIIDCRTMLTVTDSPAVSLFSQIGGVITCEDGSGIVSAGNRAVFVFMNGMINIPNSEIYDTIDNGLFVLYSGSIISTNSIIDTCSRHGVIINYGGSIDINGSTVKNCTQSNIVAESSGVVHAFGVTCLNSLDHGLVTSYGGFIQFDQGNSGGHTNFDAYSLGSGFINLKDAVIDGTSNGGGSNTMLRVIGEGTIYAEEPIIGVGKTALVASNYDPSYNTLGNGAEYIGTYAQNDAIVFTATQSYGTASYITMSGGVITADKSFIEIDTEGVASTDNLNAINGGIVGMRLVIKAANNSRTVVLKDETGNLALAGDCSLGHEKDTIELNYTNLNVWQELSRSINI